MKQTIIHLVIIIIALILCICGLFKEFKKYIHKYNKFKNNPKVQEGIIKQVIKTKFEHSIFLYKYTVYVELQDGKTIKTIIKPYEGSFGRSGHRYSNGKKPKVGKKIKVLNIRKDIYSNNYNRSISQIIIGILILIMLIWILLYITNII